MTAQVAEGAREWETLKYDSFFIPNTVFNNTEVPIPRDALSSCAETGLTAFAQLAALRLNAQRALISLFDRDYQYIVAEATQKIPLRANAKYAGEHLWLCGTAVPRAYGVCDHVITEYQYPGPSVDDADASTSSPHKNKGPLKVSVVPDLSQDSRFCARPYVKDAPHHRFYAGVPIRTPKGFNIGVLCVFDDKPRASLDAEELQFMQDVSETIMDYLDSRRVNDSYLRSERMVLGLGNFIQGKDQPSNWWPTPKPHANRKPQPDQVISPRIEKVNGILEVHDAAEDPIRPGINPTAPAEQESPSKGESSHSVETTTTNTSSNPNAAPVDPHKTEVDKIFNKAANIIRESLDVDGALFLDASVGSWGGLVGPNHQRSGNLTDDPTSSSEDSSSGQSKDPNEEEPCKIFALSTVKRPVFGEDNPTEQTSLTEKFLKKLLRRYPNGKIFSFDEGGAWYSGESSGEETDQPSSGDAESEDKDDHLPPRPSKNSASPYSRRNEAKTIGQLFPGARSIAMVPLWDPYRDRWYSGGFIWSSTPSRILTTQADLPYLRAFGMITMSEITRLDVVIADKAKTDILGSLSHELRSPLHGVVAAAELLHDTALDGFQIDVVHTIEISGKTLLDTIDHLLAYSKINTFLRASKSQRKNNRVHRGMRRDGHSQSHTSIESGMMTLVSDVALDGLAEEVIESVFIGHSFQHMVASQLTRHGARGDMTPAQERLDTIYSVDIAHSRSTPENLPTNLGDVQIVIDIDPQNSWMFHTQPGAIRRIIMNLFGNALKYTSHGHIKISLRQEGSTQKSARSPPNVVLTVSDTGKGISEEFLRNKLFTPFSQEDHLAPGTGLGLSLVRQIVLSLGGSISVKSDLGHGTAVSVSLPLPFSQKPAEDIDQRLGFDATAIRSLRACTIGFTEDRRAREQVDGTSDLLMDSLPLKWYNMQRCQRNSDGTIPPEADFVIYSEAAFSSLDEAAIRSHKIPGVIICHNAPNAMKMDTVLKQAATGVVFEFIHQPNTPRKFGKTVTSAVLRWKQLSAVKALGSLPSSDETLAEDGSPPTMHKSSVRFAQDHMVTSPAVMTPFGKPVADVTCRLWNLDVDPEFTLSLPRRRRSSRSSPTEPNSINGRLGSISEDNGVNGVNGNGHHGGEKAQTNGIDGHNGVNGVAEEPVTDGSHFLVVDDNPINLKILCSFMKRSQRQHCTATNGLEALEQFKQNPAKFGCILMDINMPVMDGLESTRQIRQHERQHQLEPTLIIAITGLGSRSAREEAFASGLDLFLTRPVRMNELRTILKERGFSLEFEKSDSVKNDHVMTNGKATNGETTNGETTNGETTNGETTNGETTNGETTNGETTNGETTNGETTNGETTNGETTNSETTNGQVPEMPVMTNGTT